MKNYENLQWTYSYYSISRGRRQRARRGVTQMVFGRFSAAYATLTTEGIRTVHALITNDDGIEAENLWHRLPENPSDEYYHLIPAELILPGSDKSLL